MRNHILKGTVSHLKILFFQKCGIAWKKVIPGRTAVGMRDGAKCGQSAHRIYIVMFCTIVGL